jgi:signal transduction histidine kinase
MSSQNVDITILVVAGIAVMLLLVVSFLVITVVNQRKKSLLQKSMSRLKEQQQNQLIEAAVRSEEVERHRIAEMLHDEVGALLSSSRIFLVEMNIKNLNETDQQDHTKVKDLIDESIKKVRSISHNLHSAILKEFGLNEAIRHFMKTVAGGIAVSSLVEMDENYMLSNAETDLAIYRIIQELVNNILKHAHAKHIHIQSWMKNDNTLKLTLRHNGEGLSQQQFEELRFKHEGLGLKNIQNRVILLKGKILFEKKSQNDCSVHIEIPIQS